jgi:hypothetical protein
MIPKVRAKNLAHFLRFLVLNAYDLEKLKYATDIVVLPAIFYYFIKYLLYHYTSSTVCLTYCTGVCV